MKILDRYLDRYYAVKLGEAIKTHLIVNYFADCRLAYCKDSIKIQAKRRKLNDQFYTSIFTIFYEYALFDCADIRRTQETVKNAYFRLMKQQKLHL